MRYLLLSLFCFFAQLAADPFEELQPSSSEEIASLSGDLLIGGFICPLSGQAFIHETDLLVRGAQNVSLERIYHQPQVAGVYDERDESRDQFFLARALMAKKSPRWMLYSYLWLGFNIHTSTFQVRDPTGFVLEFEIEGNRGILKTPYGCSNLKQNGPDSTADLRNIEFTLKDGVAHLVWPDGTERIYSKQNLLKYQLEEERLPNGKSIFYEYEGHELARIVSADNSRKYTYATIERLGWDHYRGSDGREAHFSCTSVKVEGWNRENHQKQRLSYEGNTLDRASSSAYDHSITYNERTLLSSYDAMSYPVSFEYSKKRGSPARVTRLNTPTGFISLSYKTAVAGKKEGWTKVDYENGAQKVYRFNKELLLTAIENWQGELLVNQKLYIYDDKQHLCGIETRDGTGILLIAHRYTCDEAGNPLLEQIEADGTSIERAAF